MMAVFEVMFRIFYYTVEAREYSDLALHLGDNHIPKFSPKFASFLPATVKDWRRFVIAVMKQLIHTMLAVSTLHHGCKPFDNHDGENPDSIPKRP
jgi:hypothetical protein